MFRFLDAKNDIRNCMNVFWKYLRIISNLISDKTGRAELRLKLSYRTWPVNSWLAFFYRRTLIRKVIIVVVIGSLGKTSTTKAIKIALGLKSSDKAISNKYSTLVISILRINPFSQFQVFEVAISNLGNMDEIGWIIQPDIVVFTTVGLDHAPNFKDINHIRDEKAQMLSYIRKGGRIFCNGDDENVMKKVRQSGVPFVSYGYSVDNQTRCLNYTFDLRKGMNCEVKCADNRFNIQSGLFGEKMVYPLLAAVSVGRVLNLRLDIILSNLENLEPANGRMQVEVLPNKAIAIGDFYKATIDSIKPAFEIIKKSQAKRKIIVFGDIGYLAGNNKKTCFKVGEEIAKIATHAIFVGDMENDFYQGIVNSKMNIKNVVRTNNSLIDAFKILPKNLNENDIIYITGRSPQKMERIFLLMKGEKINCDLKWCKMFAFCKDCARKNLPANENI